MAELHPYDVSKRPIVTEKSNGLIESVNQYAFEVASTANKMQIKDAVELIFDVPGKVLMVRTMVVPAKRARRGRKFYFRTQQWKKAVVTLEAGTELQLFNV